MALIGSHVTQAAVGDSMGGGVEGPPISFPTEAAPNVEKAALNGKNGRWGKKSCNVVVLYSYSITTLFIFSTSLTQR